MKQVWSGYLWSVATPTLGWAWRKDGRSGIQCAPPVAGPTSGTFGSEPPIREKSRR